tara:strand:+ start:585 stop:770 length:186 start_codon:yes stop_codon:yes gene_type:complete
MEVVTVAEVAREAKVAAAVGRSTAVAGLGSDSVGESAEKILRRAECKLRVLCDRESTANAV